VDPEDVATVVADATVVVEEAEAEVVAPVLLLTLPANLVSVVAVDSAYPLDRNLRQESFRQLCLPWI
jgi:hypothetical protein